MAELTLGYLLISFFAGVLTILAPCVLPLLPLIISGVGEERSLKRPLAIILSLGASIVIFTLLLQASLALIGVPVRYWYWFSGGILLIFGLLTLMPETWDKLVAKLKFKSGSQQLLGTGLQRRGLAGYMIVGFSLGPIFFSCSPTYAAILAVVLPASASLGLVYLLVYVAGLIGVMLLLAWGGQFVAKKLGFLANPRGWFKRSVGVLLVITGLLIITGFYKDIEAWLIRSGLYDPVINLELELNPEGVPITVESP